MPKVLVTVTVDVDERIGPDAPFYGWQEDPIDHAIKAVREQVRPLMNPEHDWDGRTVRVAGIYGKRSAV